VAEISFNRKPSW